MTELAKVLTASDKAAKAMNSAAANLKKTFDGLESFVDVSHVLTSEIEDKQSELNALTQETEDAIRRAKAEMDLRILEDRKGVMLGLMEEFGMAEINHTALAMLQEQVVEAERDISDLVEKEVKAAESKLHSRYNSQIATLEADHRVAVAEKDAAITAKNQEISFMHRQISSLEETVAAERKARVDVANAESQRQGVVVNTTSK